MIPEEAIFRSCRTVAVVGLSALEHRDSHRVARYLKEHGYHVVPVNPHVTVVLGETCYPDLSAVPLPIDVVSVFRRPEYVPDIVEAAIAAGARAIWMQEGIVHEEAARRAREAGLEVVMDKCMMTEHRAIIGGEE